MYKYTNLFFQYQKNSKNCKLNTFSLHQVSDCYEIDFPTARESFSEKSFCRNIIYEHEIAKIKRYPSGTPFNSIRSVIFTKLDFLLLLRARGNLSQKRYLKMINAYRKFFFWDSKNSKVSSQYQKNSFSANGKKMIYAHTKPFLWNSKNSKLNSF